MSKSAKPTTRKALVWEPASKLNNCPSTTESQPVNAGNGRYIIRRVSRIMKSNGDVIHGGYSLVYWDDQSKMKGGYAIPERQIGELYATLKAAQAAAQADFSSTFVE